jgi:hypothetical protein
MKRLLSLLIVLLICSILIPIKGQDRINNSSRTGICYASNKVNKFYIPPPAVFFRKSLSKIGRSITINYNGFSSQAKTALNYAASILETLLPADTKFTIQANWQAISTTGVLAQSSITGFILGSVVNAPNPLSYYPVALAEKMSGNNLSDGLSGEISLTVNSSINWYLGTDGNTPSTRYDLVTVAIHEICHGLGFFDSFDGSGTLGSWGLGSLPLIYDTFIENNNGIRLTDTLKIPNNSTNLETQLTGNQVYFNGPLLKNYALSVTPNFASRAKLYAPSTWNSGSSISHLDTSTPQVNSLMNPYIDLGEAIHNPGNYIFSILGDLGWIHTRVIHNTIKDTEAHLAQLELSAEIKSDTLYNHNKVGVVISFDKFLTTDSLYLNSPLSDNTYSTLINIPSYNSELQYYFFVEDYFKRIYNSPSLIKDVPLLKLQNTRYHVFVGTDTVKPVINHTPVKYYLQSVDSIKFNATATDNLGIDSVYVEYRLNNGPSKFVRMSNTTGNNYSVKFSAKPLDLKGHDSIEYKLFAVDTARVPNLASYPKTGFIVTSIEELTSTLTNYSTDFSEAEPDFFNNGFTVSKPAGFSKFGLNSKHPYESPDTVDESIEYISILRHPLKLDATGLLFSYNEVVLVEPGETGAVFGSSDFYDYVIVEGSKNFGKTWFSLRDGYSSTLFSTWLTAYNSSIVGDNSTFVGNESMLKKHSFLYRPSANISAGDTMLVRFRLYSDPFANGWGWVVEDLNISPLVDAISEVADPQVKLFPNPGRGLIRLSYDAQDQESYKPLHYKVFNASGICLLDSKTSGSTETLIDISDSPPGLYIILLFMDDGIKTIKYSLIK